MIDPYRLFPKTCAALDELAAEAVVRVLARLLVTFVRVQRRRAREQRRREWAVN
jgi:hypothetical protein